MAIAKRFKLMLIALVLEIAVLALAMSFPLADKGWFVPLMPFVAPGSALMFLVSGGNSSMDGIAPDWRVTLALVLGFLLNTAIMYCVCLLVRKVYIEVRPAFKWKDLK